ncbi:transposase [Mesorhizobium sangaii]|uniref:Transposase n=1 Tax=Mesorhizobium sangaii TaxID=505389 RepID=A0A841PZA8_9HYPH|nr:transposase [Mesorhizobium sangaii]
MRGILRGFGLKVGRTTPRGFTARIHELVADHPNLKMGTAALLSVHAVLLREFQAFERKVRAPVRLDVRARRLMSMPGVGPIVALTLCFCDRRSGAISLVEAGRSAFRPDPEEVSIRRDRL